MKEEIYRRPTISFSGNVNTFLLLGLGLIFSLFALALLAVLSLFAGEFFTVPAAAFYSVAVVSAACLFSLIFRQFYPVKAWPVLFNKEVPKEIKNLARLLARDWRRVSMACFDPASDVNGNKEFPGLRRIYIDGTQELILLLDLPRFKVPGQRDTYIENSMQNLFTYLELADISFENKGPRLLYKLTLIDVTQEVRNVY